MISKGFTLKTASRYFFGFCSHWVTSPIIQQVLEVDFGPSTKHQILHKARVSWIEAINVVMSLVDTRVDIIRVNIYVFFVISFCLFSFFDRSTESVCFRLRRTHHVSTVLLADIRVQSEHRIAQGSLHQRPCVCRKFKAHSNLHKRVARLVSVSPWDCSCARYIWGQSK